MNFRSSIQFGQRVRLFIHPLYSKMNKVIDVTKNYRMPERFKGTFVERWANYWKNIYADYKEVFLDTMKECKERPIRASIYTTVLGSGYYLSKHNPDMDSFREQLVQNSIKLMQVGETIRNPVSVQHMKWLEQCSNQGIVRRFNIGILSVIWLDNYDKECSLYKAVCPYLKPRYLTAYERVIDIGLLDKWWMLEKKMIDYDVNYEELNILNTT